MRNLKSSCFTIALFFYWAVVVFAVQPVLRQYTVATLPSASSNSGVTVFVTDAASTSSCGTGSGSYVVFCKSNGTTWAVENSYSTVQSATVTYSATPVFTCTATGAQSFSITLTGNVTSSTLTGCGNGELISFRIIQDATGGRSFAWPTNVIGPATINSTINSTASTALNQSFVYDGTNATYPSSPSITGGTSSLVTIPGATSGAATVGASATGGVLQLNGANATVTASGALTVASCVGCATAPIRAIGTIMKGSPVVGTTDIFRVPFACTIINWSLNLGAGDTGTATVKFWKLATGGTAVPTSTNSINTSGVSLASGTAIKSTTLTDFTTTAVAADDWMAVTITALTGSPSELTAVLGCQ